MNELIFGHCHPRSGSNMFRTILAMNYFCDRDISGNAGLVGHWSNRVKVSARPNAGNLLAGGHQFYNGEEGRHYYLYRDGRDVCLSLWRTPHFKNKDLDDNLTEFLQRDIDWRGSLGFKEDHPFQNVIEHWYEHMQN